MIDDAMVAMTNALALLDAAGASSIAACHLQQAIDTLQAELLTRGIAQLHDQLEPFYRSF